MLGKSSVRSDDVGLLLGEGVSIEGKITFTGKAKLDGNFDGEILSGDELVVGEAAVIKAEIKVDIIIVHGEVNGNVSAMTKTEIHSTGRVHGNISTPDLVVQAGAIFQGKCEMGGDRTRRNEEVPSLKLKEDSNQLTEVKDTRPLPIR